jgi:hypothetical protein
MQTTRSWRGENEKAKGEKQAEASVRHKRLLMQARALQLGWSHGWDPSFDEQMMGEAGQPTARRRSRPLIVQAAASNGGTRWRRPEKSPSCS